MDLDIRPGDGLPIYRQIVRQITDAIAGGRLAPGDRLPSHRDLAEQAVIAPLTVKKAYDELERDGLIETRRGRGTFVREHLPEIDASERRERLRDLAERLLAQAALARVPYADVVGLLNDVREEMER